VVDPARFELHGRQEDSIGIGVHFIVEPLESDGIIACIEGEARGGIRFRRKDEGIEVEGGNGQARGDINGGEGEGTGGEKQRQKGNKKEGRTE
jgi:hypothetical protein